jgi:hypothetical protein
MCVGTGDRLGIPEIFKTGLEDHAEGSRVNPHCSDKSLIFAAFVEASPRCPKPRVREEVWTAEVLSTRTPVFNGPRVIFIRANDQNCGEEPRPILDLVFMFNFEPMLREEVVQEEEVVVHG